MPESGHWHAQHSSSDQDLRIQSCACGSSRLLSVVMQRTSDDVVFVVNPELSRNIMLSETQSWRSDDGTLMHEEKASRALSEHS